MGVSLIQLQLSVHGQPYFTHTHTQSQPALFHTHTHTHSQPYFISSDTHTASLISSILLTHTHATNNLKQITDISNQLICICPK